MTRDEERAIEWDCQKVWRQCYHYVDHHEYEKAVPLFTEDVSWDNAGLELKGRDELLAALYGCLGNDTIRHVLTNMLVDVIDEHHAEARAYNTVSYSREGRREDMDGPLQFDGPRRLVDHYAKFRRVGDQWQIAARWGLFIFRRPNEPTGLEEYADKKSTLAPSS